MAKIKVKVTKLGYYDLKRRRPGEILTIDEKLFSKNWMVKVTDEQVKSSKAAKVQQEELPEVATGDADVI